MFTKNKNLLVLMLGLALFIVTIVPITNSHIQSFVEDENMVLEEGLENYNCLDTADKIYDIINSTNESTLQYYLETLTTDYKGRVTGSDVCYDAGDWIYNEFEKMPNLNVKKQSWSSRGNIYHKFKWYSGNNIIAELPGCYNDSMVFVFSAHYDVGNRDSPGALDNGAGIAALLTAAKALYEYDFRYTIRFIAFSGEEQGLLGSYAYAKEAYNNGDQILGVLNADVIGNNTYHSNGKYHWLRVFSTYPVKWIVEIMNETSNDYNIGITVKDFKYYGNSDDKAFDDYGYGAMQLFQSAGKMEPFYGKSNDTVGLINISYLLNVTKCIASSLAVLADMSDIYPRINIILPLEDSVFGWRTLHLSKGKTVVIGSPKVKTKLDSGNTDVQKVVFEFIEGDNEYKSYSEVGYAIANFTDDTLPYEWIIDKRCFEWHTIRATVYDVNGNFTCDEIEIWIFHP